MGDKLFRTKIFGGYRKEDVKDYVTKLELELMKVQAQLQVSLTPSESSKQQNIDNIDEDVIVLNDIEGDYEGVKEESTILKEAAVKESTEVVDSVEQQKEFVEVKLECEKVKRDLETAKVQLERINQVCEKNEARLKAVSAEKKQLEDEVEKLREEKKNYEKDYDAIKEVLLNAKVNAEIVITRARKEANLLLEDTQRQITEQKKESITELMRHLTENYNGLQVSKYYMEEQAKNIDCMEKQIKSIQCKMESFLGMDANKEENLKAKDQKGREG